MCALDKNNVNERKASALLQYMHERVKQNANRDNI